MPKALSQNRLHIGLGIEHVRRTRNQAQEVRNYPEISLITLQGCLRLSRDGFFSRNSNAGHKFSLFLSQCSDVLHFQFSVPTNRYTSKLCFPSLASTTFPSQVISACLWRTSPHCRRKCPLKAGYRLRCCGHRLFPWIVLRR